MLGQNEVWGRHTTGGKENVEKPASGHLMKERVFCGNPRTPPAGYEAGIPPGHQQVQVGKSIEMEKEDLTIQGFQTKVVGETDDDMLRQPDGEADVTMV